MIILTVYKIHENTSVQYTMIKQYKEFLVFYHHHIIWEYFPYI